MKTFLMLLFIASPVLAAPKIDQLSVKANPKLPEVEIALAVTKTGGTCDVRIEFGDGKGRTVDFGLATSRTLKYSYKTGGKYTVTAKGTGKTPCEGARDVALNVVGPKPEAKKADPKKDEKKKAEKKKADKKSASKKKKEEAK
jgi:hypothetical protein